MSVDLSEFYDRPSKKCVVARKIEQLSVEDREKFETAMAETKITAASIFRWLSKRDITVNRDSVRCHRIRECACRD